MPKPKILSLQAIIPDKASAISFSGGKGDSCRVVLDIFAEDPAELAKVLAYRGERLIVTLMLEDDVERSRKEPTQ